MEVKGSKVKDGEDNNKVEHGDKADRDLEVKVSKAKDGEGNNKAEHGDKEVSSKVVNGVSRDSKEDLGDREAPREDPGAKVVNKAEHGDKEVSSKVVNGIKQVKVSGDSKDNRVNGVNRANKEDHGGKEAKEVLGVKVVRDGETLVKENGEKSRDYYRPITYQGKIFLSNKIF